MPAVQSRTIRLFSYRRILLASGVFWSAIAIALIVLWVQSCNRYLAVEVKNSEGRFGVSIVYGVLNFVWDRSGMFLNHPTDWSLIAVPAQVLPDPSEVFRFHHKPFRPIRQGSIDVRFPVAGPVVFAAAMAIFSFWRRAKAFPKGHCTLCGYNLYGNTSGLCPECGAEARGVPAAPEPESGPSPTRWQRVLRATWLTLVGATGLAILVWLVSIGWAWQLDRMKPGNVAVVAPSLTAKPWWAAPPMPPLTGATPLYSTTTTTGQRIALSAAEKFLNYISFADPKVPVTVRTSSGKDRYMQVLVEPGDGRPFVLEVDGDGTLSLVNEQSEGKVKYRYLEGDPRDMLPPANPRLTRALTFLALESGSGLDSLTHEGRSAEPGHDLMFVELQYGVWYVGLNLGGPVEMVPISLDGVPEAPIEIANLAGSYP